MDYRMIALHMTAAGTIIGHSTVRNSILRTMEKFAIKLMNYYNVEGDASKLAQDPNFQKSIAELLQDTMQIGEQNGN